MNDALRLSPIYDSLQQLGGVWHDINGMKSLYSLPDDEVNAARLGIANLSFIPRFGVKGAIAAIWLESQSIPIPDRPNSWYPLPEGGIIARLGSSEFLIEDSNVAPKLIKACKSPPAKVYPILRQDLAIALIGSKVNELLLQTCSFNFQSLSITEHPVILTSMAVNATVIQCDRNGQPFYKIWCDGTFGVYLWQTLNAIAIELGGGAIGLETLIATSHL